MDAIETGNGNTRSVAIEELRRARFFAELDEAYGALRAEPEAWTAEIEDRAAWDAALMDGLDVD